MQHAWINNESYDAGYRDFMSGAPYDGYNEKYDYYDYQQGWGHAFFDKFPSYPKDC